MEVERGGVGGGGWVGRGVGVWWGMGEEKEEEKEGGRVQGPGSPIKS